MRGASLLLAALVVAAGLAWLLHDRGSVPGPPALEPEVGGDEVAGSDPSAELEPVAPGRVDVPLPDAVEDVETDRGEGPADPPGEGSLVVRVELGSPGTSVSLPLAGERVLLVSTDAHERIAEGLTDELGEVRFSGLEPGPLRVAHASAPPRFPRTMDVTVTRKRPAECVFRVGELVAKEMRVWSYHVGGGYQPIAGATVAVSLSGQLREPFAGEPGLGHEQVLATDLEGVVEIPGEVGAWIDAHASAPGFVAGALTRLDLGGEGVEHRMNLVLLSDDLEVRGRVFHADDTPIEGVRFEWLVGLDRSLPPIEEARNEDRLPTLVGGWSDQLTRTGADGTWSLRSQDPETLGLDGLTAAGVIPDDPFQSAATWFLPRDVDLGSLHLSLDEALLIR